jgi:hypothetical protein
MVGTRIFLDLDGLLFTHDCDSLVGDSLLRIYLEVEHLCGLTLSEREAIKIAWRLTRK